MRPVVRLVACALLAVFVGTPAWAAACDINCEAASRQALKQPAVEAVASPMAHHHGDHHGVPHAAAANTVRSRTIPSAHLVPIADDCESAGLVVTAGTTPSASRSWQAHLAPVLVSTVAAPLRLDGRMLRSPHRLVTPSPDRPLAAILRI